MLKRFLLFLKSILNFFLKKRKKPEQINTSIVKQEEKPSELKTETPEKKSENESIPEAEKKDKSKSTEQAKERVRNNDISEYTEPKKKKAPKTKKKIKFDYLYARADDVPDIIEKGIVYIIGDEGFEWLLAFKCPCGCNEVIQLNMLKEAKPCWRVKCFENKSVTIIPSINRIRNCRSHFTITKGKIDWYGEPNRD